MSRIILVFLASILSASLFAHHSTYEFDTDVTIELIGEFTRMLWRSPHVRM